MAVTKQHLNSEDIDLSTDTIKLTSNGTGYSSIDYGAIPPITIGTGIGTSGTNFTYTTTPSVTLGTGLTGTSANAIWTTNSTTGIDWSAVGANIKPAAKISLQGEGADIELGGKSMRAWMEKVEERLNIMTPNVELEKEWDELRKLGEKYRKLEKKCKEKAEVWKKLNKL